MKIRFLIAIFLLSNLNGLLARDIFQKRKYTHFKNKNKTIKVNKPKVATRNTFQTSDSNVIIKELIQTDSIPTKIMYRTNQDSCQDIVSIKHIGDSIREFRKYEYYNPYYVSPDIHKKNLINYFLDVFCNLKNDSSKHINYIDNYEIGEILGKNGEIKTADFFYYNYINTNDAMPWFHIENTKSVLMFSKKNHCKPLTVRTRKVLHKQRMEIITANGGAFKYFLTPICVIALVVLIFILSHPSFLLIITISLIMILLLIIFYWILAQLDKMNGMGM